MELTYDTVNDTVRMLIKRELSKDDFGRLDKEIFSEKIAGYINEAAAQKDVETLDSLVYIVFLFDLRSERLLEIFNRLLTETWHFKHEDLADLINEYRSDTSVDYLRRAAVLRLDYLTYDGDVTFALANKCIWALGNIGTERAKECLIQLSRDNNAVIADYAKKQLNRL